MILVNLTTVNTLGEVLQYCKRVGGQTKTCLFVVPCLTISGLILGVCNIERNKCNLLYQDTLFYGFSLEYDVDQLRKVLCSTKS